MPRSLLHDTRAIVRLVKLRFSGGAKTATLDINIAEMWRIEGSYFSKYCVIDVFSDLMSFNDKFIGTSDIKPIF